MKCFERIASFYLPKYLIATYIVEITSGWRVIETIASFRAMHYRTQLTYFTYLLTTYLLGTYFYWDALG